MSLRSGCRWRGSTEPSTRSWWSSAAGRQAPWSRFRPFRRWPSSETLAYAALPRLPIMGGHVGRFGASCTGRRGGLLMLVWSWNSRCGRRRRRRCGRYAEATPSKTQPTSVTVVPASGGARAMRGSPHNPAALAVVVYTESAKAIFQVTCGTTHRRAAVVGIRIGGNAHC